MNCMAFRYPSRVPFNKLKMETYLFLDSDSKHCFCKVGSESRRKDAKIGG